MRSVVQPRNSICWCHHWYSLIASGLVCSSSLMSGSRSYLVQDVIQPAAVGGRPDGRAHRLQARLSRGCDWSVASDRRLTQAGSGRRCQNAQLVSRVQRRVEAGCRHRRVAAGPVSVPGPSAERQAARRAHTAGASGCHRPGRGHRRRPLARSALNCLSGPRGQHQLRADPVSTPQPSPRWTQPSAPQPPPKPRPATRWQPALPPSSRRLSAPPGHDGSGWPPPPDTECLRAGLTGPLGGCCRLASLGTGSGCARPASGADWQIPPGSHGRASARPWSTVRRALLLRRRR